MKDDVLTAVQDLEPIAADCGLTMAQLAVAWVLQNDNVSAAIIGASRPEQVTENVKAAGVTLEPAAMKAIDEVLEGIIERDPSLTKSPESRDFG
jgi:aryl-alcohol dehydrogenase-like predicted oxidoreductase